MIKSDFTATAYDVSQFNLVIGCFIKSGCVGINDLKVAFRDGSATVGEGVYILPDGDLLTVDREGFAISKKIESGYICIKNKEICHTSEAETDCILLAQITNGKCIDLRQMAYIYTEEGVM